MKKLNICYATDDNYMEYTRVSIFSMLENNKYINEMVFYILDNDICTENKRKLEKLVLSYDMSIYWLDVSSYIEDIKRKGGLPYRGYSSYARIFIDKVLPKSVDKLLYIDSDTLVLDDLSPLLEVDFKGSVLAGVLDLTVPEYKKAIQFANSDKYINSGILFINRLEWIQQDCEKRLIDNLYKVCIASRMPDQDLINITLKKEISILPLSYNMYDLVYSMKLDCLKRIFRIKEKVYYSETEFAEALKSPKIIHFTCGLLGRPWTTYCIHPQKSAWLNYYKKLNNMEWKVMPAESNFKSKLICKIYKIFPNVVFSYFYMLIRKVTGWGVINKYKQMDL